VAGLEKPLESCAVCHGDDSLAAVDEAHVMDPEMAVSNVAFAVNGADLVVTFNLKANGANATDFATLNRQYQFAGGLRNNLGSVDSTIPGDVVTPSTLSGGTGGNYTITVAGGAIHAATNSRYLFRVENPAGVRAVVVGDYPSAPDGALVSSAGCSGCHGNAGEGGFHYGYPASGATCTVCHDATNTNYPRLVNIGHGIHNAHGMPSGEYVLETVNGDESWTYHTTYPTYMTNCSVCHTESSGALAKANAMPVTAAGCFTCHGSMESWDFTASGTTFHEAYDESTNCSTCHTPNGIAPAVVTAFHNGIVTERGGIIWDGADTSVTEGQKFTWQITSIVDNGTNLAISWTATYNGSPVNPCNATAGPGAPVFHAAAGGNLSMLRSYFQGDDPILGRDPNAPGQALAVNVTTTNTACANNVATTTIAVDAGATGRGIVALQGKPRVVSVANSAQMMSVRVPTPTREWVVGTGALPAEQRRAIADTGQCLKCHVGSLYQHGGNRVDNVTMCVLCHNSASSDQHIRVGMGVDASEGYDGKVSQTFEFKTMLHAIHTAGMDGQEPIVIYRNRGIYAWATDDSLLQNWPGASSTPIPVFGSDPASPNANQVHNFHSPTYPRLANDCAACHVAGFDTMVEQTKGMATTTNAGAAPWGNQLDDTLQGANSAACTSCHQDAASVGHANQNGWVPAKLPNGRQTIIDAAK
jgi:OmcA/MtrC family decaheme c-type cytochrome